MKTPLRLAALVVATLAAQPSLASDTCTRLDRHAGQQVLRNGCGHAITLVHCGVNPTGNASLDCNRRQLAMQGVRPNGIVIVGDARGSYGRVHWMECAGGKTPSNVRWTGREIQGDCPR